jgi:hypothetical protein
MWRCDVMATPFPFWAKQTRRLSNTEIGLCLRESGEEANFVYAMRHPLVISGAQLSWQPFGNKGKALEFPT